MGSIRHVHAIIVDKLLRKVIHLTFDAAANTLGAIRLSGAKLAPNFMALALRTLGKLSQALSRRENGCGEEHSHARALDILGA